MGEMIQKKFREMLDSVSSASDEFVNKYFSDDSVDLNIDASSETDEIEDEDVEVIKGENTDDWFNYNSKESDELISEKINSGDIEDDSISLDNEEEIKKDNIQDDKKESNIENEIISSDDIEKDILATTLNLEDELELNYDYTDIEKQISESNEDNQVSKDNKSNELAEEQEKNNEKVETVKDTQYKKLSSDELIKLLNKTDNGEDFFKEVEV